MLEAFQLGDLAFLFKEGNTALLLFLPILLCLSA
jgi:hypothetical protein